jgi:uncharacterized protein YjbJ (UPF0337 family)
VIAAVPFAGGHKAVARMRQECRKLSWSGYTRLARDRAMCVTAPTGVTNAATLRSGMRRLVVMSPTSSTDEGKTMNWDVIEGNWKQFKGLVKEKWGKLTDDHLDTIAGKRDQLAGRLQEAYGITKDQAELQLKAFEEVHKDYQPRSSM